MSIRSRAVAALSLAALAASLVVSPAAAGVSTIWVDDDGTAGPSGCAGGATAPVTIQGGVDLAAPGDTVKVCPGTYREYVTIATPGVTLVAADPWTAVVKTPLPGGASSAGDATMIAIAEDDVTVKWMKIVTPSAADCLGNSAGILANGVDGAHIRSNRIIGGSNQYSRNCGLAVGIELTNGTGEIAFNLVRNYNVMGITVFSSSSAKVIGNSVHWNHPAQTCAIACLQRRATPAGGPGQPAIQVSMSSVRVRSNHLEVDAGADVPAEGGLVTYGSSVKIRQNTVVGFDYGIAVMAGSTGLVEGNQLRRGQQTGLLLDSIGVTTAQLDPAVTVKDNRIRAFQNGGLVLSTSPGNLIQGNDVAGPGTDCIDLTIPTTSAWLDNIGKTSNQVGLCEPPAP